MRAARDTSRLSGGGCRGSQELRRARDLQMVQEARRREKETARRGPGGDEQTREHSRGIRDREEKKTGDFDYGSRSNIITWKRSRLLFGEDAAVCINRNRCRLSLWRNIRDILRGNRYSCLVFAEPRTAVCLGAPPRSGHCNAADNGALCLWGELKGIKMLCRLSVKTGML